MEESMYAYHRMKRSGRLIDEHRLIMENHIGRKLTRNEVVHHIDGNRSNNSLENLQLMTLSEHSRIHNKGKSLSESTKEKLSQHNRGKLNPKLWKYAKDDVLKVELLLKMGFSRRKTASIAGYKESFVGSVMRRETPMIRQALKRIYE